MGIVLSLGFGLLVGVAYGLANIKSPAPPIVALFGLLGMVIGEQGVARLQQRGAAPTSSAAPATSKASEPAKPGE